MSERQSERRSERPIPIKQVILPGPRPVSQLQATAGLAIVVIIAIIIGALYLAQATSTATTGSQLLQLQRTRDSLQRANDDIESQIALKRDISVLTDRARALGFVTPRPDQVQWVVVEGYYPDRATPTSTPQPQPTALYDQSFNGWMQQNLDQLTRQFEAWAGRAGATPTLTP